MSFQRRDKYFRSLVAGSNTKVPLANGKKVTAVNFDNAATTPPFFSVLNAINDFAPWYASVHRGTGYKSIMTSEVYERGREVVRSFVNADPSDTIIFTKSTTESINILAFALSAVEDEAVVLSTDMEHLANDLPWRDKFCTEFITTNRDGTLSVKELEARLIAYEGKVKLVTVTGASNVTGYVNPIYKIARIAHKYGAKILVDGAQLVPHAPVDMKPRCSPEHIDYLVFSAHKMYAPFGAGVLIGPKDTFTAALPMCQGGGAVGLVSRNVIEWRDPPEKYEAGTPNMMGVLALTAAIETLRKININDIHRYERELIEYAIEGMSYIPGVTLYSRQCENDERVSLISFNLEGIHHSQLAEILSQEAGIAIRNGLFCAHPYVTKLLEISNEEIKYHQTHDDPSIPGLARISFGMYNNLSEIDNFLNVLAYISRGRKEYARKYEHLLKKKRDDYCAPLPYC